MYTAIHHVHLELTERCNAACPMCGRNVHGGSDNPRLIGAELSLQQIKTLLPPDFLAGLTQVLACGNYGDPIVTTDLLPILRYLRAESPVQISLNTNGSLRGPVWWEQLGRLLSRSDDLVKFSIDGLADTNTIYRRGTKFSRIIRNAQSFIGAGGIADWEFIVFRHNEHQVEEAHDMAMALGFRRFRAKRTGRFYDPQRHEVLASYPVIDRYDRHVYDLHPPLNQQYRNDATARHHAVAEKYGSFAAYLDTTPITCKVVAANSVYISARGLVFPCCWTAQIYDGNADVADLLDRCGIDSINGLLRPIPEIVQEEFFQKVAAGWSQTCANGRLGICARICGEEFDQFRAT